MGNYRRTKGLWLCCLSFLACLFSLIDFPDFLEAVLRGDLSVMSAPFPVVTVLLIPSHHTRRWWGPNRSAPDRRERGPFERDQTARSEDGQ